MMATGFEVWIFGYVGSKLADRVLEFLRGDQLTADLHKAVDNWEAALPADAKLASTNALFPSHLQDKELTERPCLVHLRSEFKNSKVPTEECWNNALLEQWRYVRANVSHPQAFFLLSEDVASDHLKSLGARLNTVCCQHEPFFRATTVFLLRELLERSNCELQKEQPLESVLSERQKKLLRRLYQHRGLCMIKAPRGEYECLWVPGPITNMQWGWERTPEECSLSGKDPGSRENRLNWIYVVKDLVDAGIFEKQKDGYFELTERGWRIAHDLGDEKTNLES